jgi:serine kinase of HPr protein (carbohydrate metabolism regulator)
LLSTHRLYGLHAGAVERAGTSLLIVGNSGCGKTTTAVVLVRSGWRYLSDDAVLLCAQDGAVEALAFSRGFSCTPGMREHFPELAIPDVWAGEMNGTKRLIIP